jgi:hypothetical protein
VYDGSEREVDRWNWRGSMAEAVLDAEEKVATWYPPDHHYTVREVGGTGGWAAAGLAILAAIVTIALIAAGVVK